jgi:hypothetical protein
VADQREQGSDLSEAPARPSGTTAEPVVQQQQQQVQRKDEDKGD